MLPSTLQHGEQWHNGIIFPRQMQLEKQCTETDEANNNKHSDGRRSFLLDIDTTMR